MSDDLRVNMTGNRSGFQAMLQAARAETKRFAQEIGHEVSSDWTASVKRIGASFVGFLGFETLKAHIEGLIEKGSELRQTAEQFDMNTDSVQRWEKALGKAGVSWGVFTRALETIRQKRQAAGEDFKQLDPFRKVGLSSDDVFNGTDEEVMLKILRSNDRAAINDIAPRLARIKAAVPYLQGGSVPFSEQDIDQLHKNELQMKAAQSAIQKFSMKYGPGRWWINMNRHVGAMLAGDWKGMFSGMPIKSEQDILPPGTANSQVLGPPMPTDESDERRINTAEAEAKLAKEKAEYQEKELEFAQKLTDAQRENMTIADRRASIEQELLETKERLAELEKFMGPLTKEQTEESRRLLLRQQSLTHELKEKPLSFSPDSLAKVGLYSSSSIAFNPVMGVQQEQLNELRGIHNTLRTRPDPFQK